MQPLVSIIIPAYNRPDELERCLRSIRGLAFNDYETIVIDDCGQENLQAVCDKYQVEIYQRNKINSGPTVSKNNGIKLAHGEYLWFLDSDAEILSPDVLDNMLTIIANNPKIGCLGGEFYYRNLQQNDLTVKVHRTFINGDGFPGYLEPDECRMVKTIFLASANCFTRADLCHRINGFEEYYYYLYEDTDFCCKISKLGYDVIADQRTAVLHMPSMSSRFSSMYKLQKNRLIFVLLNKNWLTIISLPWLDVYYNLKFFKEKKNLFGAGNTLIKTERARSSFLSAAANFVVSLILAYLYNIVFLFKTLYIRLKPNVK